MKNKIRLIVCDLDGTLLNSEKGISEYSVNILRKVRKMGVRLCLASGRDEQMMEVYIKMLGGCDYVLSNNGALVREGSGAMLHQAVMQEEDAACILHYLNERKMVFMMYASGEMYFSENSKKLLRRIRDYELLSKEMGYPVKLKVKEFFRKSPVIGYRTTAKIVVYEEDDTRMEQYMKYISFLSGVHSESTGYGLLGTFDRQVSKKTALLKIMEVMGIGKSEVCVFGDYVNDLSMFACADYRVCMANGVESLKAEATHVTCSNDEDGVAVHLAEMFGIDDF